MKRHIKLLFPLAALALAGCQPVIELADDQLVAVDAPIGSPVADLELDPTGSPSAETTSSVSDPAAPGSASSAVSGSASTSQGSTDSTKPAGPPDWRARYAELSEVVRKKFKIPPASQQISIGMKDGRARKGFLLGVSGNRASFSIPISGRDPAKVTLERGDLGEATRRQIWVDDAVPYYAKMQLKKEKGEYDRNNPKPVAAISSANKPNQTVNQRTRPANGGNTNNGNRPGPGFIQPSTNALKPNADGSFDVVKRWLRSNINNPDSIRIHTWGKLVRDPRPGVKGYNLDVEFSSDSGGNLGRIPERKRFFLNRNGTITNTGNIRL